MKNKGTTATLAIILMILNTHRYNLPARVWLKSVFNLLDVYCWGIALVSLFLYENRPEIKAIYFFGICGVTNAMLNESIFDANLPAWTENLMMLGAVVLSLACYLYLRWKKKKSYGISNGRK